MPSWTKEQNDAIYKSGTNIIVSAGAGSGKTAVLSERVLEKLKSGIHINELLILTFTKAAAAEMKERIRKKIKKNEELKDELNLIDSSYITTFDSFAMSIVKKYHYLLNVSKNISIIESSVIEIKKKEILDLIFNNYYKNKDDDFVTLINTFCIKDDSSIKNYILNINNKLDLRLDKKEYLTNYLDTYFNKNKIDNDIKKYEDLIIEKINVIKDSVDNLSLYVDSDYLPKVYEVLDNLFNALNYDDIKNNLNIKLPSLPRGSEEEVKVEKEKLSKQIKDLSSICVYDSKEEITSSIISTKKYINIIIKIILELDEKINNYKQENDVYEFNDIAIMSIKVLDNNEVCNELKYHFKEILVDEYQDTNDLQEAFINKIENNNVYMVGDIKQSIYRFRNANPYIFKNKYDNYSKNNGGIKIDLLKNFRSRSEVLDNINTIFNLIMDDEIGGADYISTHQMVFGNNTYINEGKTKEDYNLEVLTYDDKTPNYSKEELEIFIIANDIKNKIENKYLVFDKDDLKVREITYSDFVILIDRSTGFDLYKKIFEYLKIPISILKDEKLNTDIDLMILKNILNFIIKVKNNIFDTEFKYLFTSISRSFIYNYNDSEILDYFINKNFLDSPLYKTSKEISNTLEYLSIREIIDLILDKFNFIERIMTIGNINKTITKIDKIKDISDNLSNLGYDIYKFSDYLKEIIDNDYQMTFTINEKDSDSVKIMTIHKSKGLEYHICYFPGLYKEFNLMELKEQFTYDKDYGIISPYFNEGIGKTIYSYLLKEKYKNEEISEKIRLFYVAVTRAKEKMIIILPKNNKELLVSNKSIIDKNIRKNYNSFKSIFNSIENYIKSYYKEIDTSKLFLTKDYNLVKNNNYKSVIPLNNNKIIVNEISIENNIKNNLSFSKETNKLITKEELKNMKYGTKVHELLELINFKNPNYELINDKFIENKIKKLLENNIFNNISNAKIYKEYEFIYELDNIKYHGIIDLMLEYSNYIDIIDYKLKNIKDEAYIKQLMGYKNYIENKTNKKVNIYLYSIMNENLEKII